VEEEKGSKIFKKSKNLPEMWGKKNSSNFLKNQKNYRKCGPRVHKKVEEENSGMGDVQVT
jgi:hypothetical protein